MTYLILSILSIVLLGGFFTLTQFEKRRGVRMFASFRERLDANVSKLEFVAQHVDWHGYFKDEFGRLVHRAGHDAAHVSLQAVRSVERTLTQWVRHLRTRQSLSAMPRETSRAFVRTLSDFKGHLEATRPEMPEIR